MIRLNDYEELKPRVIANAALKIVWGNNKAVPDNSQQRHLFEYGNRKT